MSTCARYAVQTLDGLQFMPVPLEILRASIASWTSRMNEISRGRDSTSLSRRAIDIAAQVLNECGVASDQVRRRLHRPSDVTGKYRWEERPAATDGKHFFKFISCCFDLQQVPNMYANWFLQWFECLRHSASDSWYSLPDSCRDNTTFFIYKRSIKTHLFSLDFGS